MLLLTNKSSSEITETHFRPREDEKLGRQRGKLVILNTGSVN